MEPGTPRHFASAAAFREWLMRHHARDAELWVGFYKKDSGRGGITYPEALDEALCYGWIDGVRKSVNATSYTIRFTPRKPRSNWSAVNVRHARRLIEAERMRPPGLAAFEAREGDKAGYSYEERPARLPPAYAKRFRAAKTAWTFFQAQPPGYRRTATFWVMDAKREATRERRLASLITYSSNGERIPLLAPPTRKLRR
jgi:uncharacterized protein YdeI (YjbR/CyaY-like superfamily)